MVTIDTTLVWVLGLPLVDTSYLTSFCFQKETTVVRNMNTIERDNPKVGEMWTTNTGQTATVVRVTNLFADLSRKDEYPTTVHYILSNDDSLALWCMRLDEWHSKMQFDRVKQAPYPGSIWKHRKNGTTYTCTGVSSMYLSDHDTCETIISYVAADGKHWSKPVIEFMAAMEKIY